MRVLLPIFALAGCATSQQNIGPLSERRVIGPAGYTVDWDLLETDYYWVPMANENDLKPTSDQCKAPLSVFVYHHLPRPPQYSYLGFRFPPEVDTLAKSCVLSRLKAVQGLTVYPKKK